MRVSSSRPAQTPDRVRASSPQWPVDAHGVEPGDKVLFPATAGYEVRLAGVVMRVIRRRELIARIQD